MLTPHSQPGDTEQERAEGERTNGVSGEEPVKQASAGKAWDPQPILMPTFPKAAICILFIFNLIADRLIHN